MILKLSFFVFSFLGDCSLSIIPQLLVSLFVLSESFLESSSWDLVDKVAFVFEGPLAIS